MKPEDMHAMESRLERRLKALVPAPPSSRLTRRLARALEVPQPGWRIPVGASVTGLVALAALAAIGWSTYRVVQVVLGSGQRASCAADCQPVSGAAAPQPCSSERP